MSKLAGIQEGKDMTKYTVRIIENRNKRGKEYETKKITKYIREVTDIKGKEDLR